MKILAHTPTQLIIRDSAVTVRAFGAFLVVLGAFAIWVGRPEAAQGRVAAFVPVVIGSLIAVGGLALMTLPSNKTFVFSKAERVFAIASERFGRVDRETFRLQDIAKIWVDESKSEDGTMYRIVVTLADGRQIPWRPYYTGGERTQRAVVDRVREFLELDSNASLGRGELPPASAGDIAASTVHRSPTSPSRGSRSDR